jgi:hypothetical protein
MDRMVYGSSTYVFIIRVMLSPFKSILPVKFPTKIIDKPNGIVLFPVL